MKGAPLNTARAADEGLRRLPEVFDLRGNTGGGVSSPFPSDGHADHFPIPPVMSIDTAHPFDGAHLQVRVHMGSFIIH
jgi:hypothetical protein